MIDGLLPAVYIFAQEFARPARYGPVARLFAVALEYLLRTSSAEGGLSMYILGPAEQYLRITPSYESRGRGYSRGDTAVDLSARRKGGRKRGRRRRQRKKIVREGNPRDKRNEDECGEIARGAAGAVGRN